MQNKHNECKYVASIKDLYFIQKTKILFFGLVAFALMVVRYFEFPSHNVLVLDAFVLSNVTGNRPAYEFVQTFRFPTFRFGHLDFDNVLR